MKALVDELAQYLRSDVEDAARLAKVAGILRGEGCVFYPNYGTTCEGIEREWWSELEWEDAYERVGAS